MLRVEESENSIIAIIDRPEADNRLDLELLLELQRVLKDLSVSTTPQKVFVLSATGRNFSLGRQRSSSPQSLSQVRSEFELIQSTNELLQDLPLVTISALQGKVEGAGLSLAGRSDIVVVADDAQLSFPEIPHGIPPTIVLSHYKYSLPKHILGDLIFTGRVLSGSEAVQFGIAARCVPNQKLEKEIGLIINQIASYDREAMRLVKSFLRDTEYLPQRDAPKLGIAEYLLHTFKSQP